MSLSKKLFGRETVTKPRVRVCVECGMPLAEHKAWCTILRTQQAMAQRAEDAPSAG